jgi:hypothetical protein
MKPNDPEVAARLLEPELRATRSYLTTNPRWAEIADAVKIAERPPPGSG